MSCAQKLNFDACDSGFVWNLSTGSSGYDMTDSLNSSGDCLSPVKGPPQPRRLDFSRDEDMDAPVGHSSPSPPYKRVRALRLFDSPATPKTILHKCSTPGLTQVRPSRRAPRAVSPAAPPPEDEEESLPCNTSAGSLRLCQEANVNPFTPDAMLLNRKKRSLARASPGPEACPGEAAEQPCKKLRESNISRYHEEFVEMELIGRGAFGSVHRCVNRLDGCQYAVKRSLRPVAGSAGEKSALNEVYAHAVLGKHLHVVRYYSAWAEDDHMIIQNEFCDGGSLADALARGPLARPQLLRLLSHAAQGLRYIHSVGLVHMDMKPGNIFLAHEGRELLYKVGDLGHVTSSSCPRLEEGDCRYLSTEVLQEDLSDLSKADIFSLGLTIYEAGGGGPLPPNGDEWHSIRRGELRDVPNIGPDLTQLIKLMIHPEARRRPSAAGLLRHGLLQGAPASPPPPSPSPSHAQLRRELEATKLKNELLEAQLLDASRCLKSIAPTVASALGRSGPEPSSALLYRRSTRSFKLARSSSNVHF